MWPGFEPVSPTLAGGLFTTETPEKPENVRFLHSFRVCNQRVAWGKGSVLKQEVFVGGVSGYRGKFALGCVTGAPAARH